MKSLVWGHRGYSGIAPENTLPSFQLAAEKGADGVELDVQLTKDGELVVCHDEKIDRTSNGAGWVKDYTLAELRQFDFCNGMLQYEGTKIPTMEEVFECLKTTGLTINIELKTGVFDYDGIEEKLVKLTHDEGFEKRVIYSSFNHYSIQKLKSIDSEAKTGFLYSDGPIDMTGYARKYGVEALHPAFYNLRFPGFVEACRDSGLDLNVWTVNNDAYIRKCVELGIHGIITNYVEKARKLVDTE